MNAIDENYQLQGLGGEAGEYVIDKKGGWR
jgi:hypothetical protein